MKANRPRAGLSWRERLQAARPGQRPVEAEQRPAAPPARADRGAADELDARLARLEHGAGAQMLRDVFQDCHRQRLNEAGAPDDLHTQMRAFHFAAADLARVQRDYERLVARDLSVGPFDDYCWRVLRTLAGTPEAAC